jgi:hypothetical protein
MANKALDQTLRLEAIHHIVHDYVNLISAGTEIPKEPKPPLNSHVQYSFILQLRKFANFFSNERRRTKGRNGRLDIDILAKDYVGSKIRYKLTEWKRWEDHMNTHIFHLSYQRTKNTRSWTGYKENPLMLAEFRSAWRLFLSKTPEPYRSEFDEEIERKRVETPDLDLS